MTEVHWVDSYNVKGGFEPHYNRIEISRHFQPEMRQLILEHELEHARLWRKKGFLSWPQQVWLDFKTTFKVFSDPKLSLRQRPKLNQSKTEKVKIIIFVLCYSLAMVFGNTPAILLGSIVGLGKSLYAKLHKGR